MEVLLMKIGLFIIWMISSLGYGGIVLAMAIESACVPLPSEVIMPFSGYLAWKGEMNLIAVGFAGALGNLIGSAVAYWAGYYGGRPFILKYGRYLLISSRELDWADRWFSKYGEATAFFSRLLPVIRTFISLPAGIARAPFWKFSLYTFLGAFPFSLALAWLGYKLGENWSVLKIYFHRMDTVIGGIILIGLAYFIWRHWPVRKLV